MHAAFSKIPRSLIYPCILEFELGLEQPVYNNNNNNYYYYYNYNNIIIIIIIIYLLR